MTICSQVIRTIRMVRHDGSVRYGDVGLTAHLSSRELAAAIWRKRVELVKHAVQQMPNGVGLSSIAQPFEELGMAAARQFLRRVQDPAATHCHIDLPVRLIIRDSSAAYLNVTRDNSHSD